jgi:hypothetical protein
MCLVLCHTNVAEASLYSQSTAHPHALSNSLPPSHTHTHLVPSPVSLQSLLGPVEIRSGVAGVLRRGDVLRTNRFVLVSLGLDTGEGGVANAIFVNL